MCVYNIYTYIIYIIYKYIYIYIYYIENVIEIAIDTGMSYFMHVHLLFISLIYLFCTITHVIQATSRVEAGTVSRCHQRRQNDHPGRQKA